jgi:hypothetical protein
VLPARRYGALFRTSELEDVTHWPRHFLSERTTDSKMVLGPPLSSVRDRG